MTTLKEASICQTGHKMAKILLKTHNLAYKVADGHKSLHRNFFDENH